MIVVVEIGECVIYNDKRRYILVMDSISMNLTGRSIY